MQLKFHTPDVFTNRRFGGNPLAVVLGADHLSTGQIQAITRELNLSETFIVPRRDGVGSLAVAATGFVCDTIPVSIERRRGLQRLQPAC